MSWGEGNEGAGDAVVAGGDLVDRGFFAVGLAYDDYGVVGQAGGVLVTISEDFR